MLCGGDRRNHETHFPVGLPPTEGRLASLHILSMRVSLKLWQDEGCHKFG